MTMRTAAIAGCVVLGLGALGGSTALAQGVNPSIDEALKRQYEESFRAVFADPGNLDKSFKFAEVAIQAGNYEGAITALERMLLINPNLPRVRLELGVLYFRLGSYELAKTYLEGALASPNVPADVRRRVEAFLEEIAKRQSRHQYGGSVFGGIRWQSNANSGPSNPGILVGGVPATLGSRFTATNDENLFIAGNIRHLYDMNTPRNEAWETNGTAYASQQFSLHDLDLIFVRVDTGPRGKFGPGVFEGVTYRPYLIGNWARLDDVPYLEALGFGGNVTAQFDPRWSADLTGEWMNRHFHNGAGGSRTIEQQNGSTADLRLTVRFAASETLMLFGSTGAGNESSNKVNMRSNDSYFYQIGVTKNYAASMITKELGIADDLWSTTFSIQRQFTEYDDPDPAVDPANARSEHETRAVLTQAIPINGDFTFIGTVQRSSTESNLPNFRRNNTAVTLGLSWRF